MCNLANSNPHFCCFLWQATSWWRRRYLFALSSLLTFILFLISYALCLLETQRVLKNTVVFLPSACVVFYILMMIETCSAGDELGLVISA